MSANAVHINPYLFGYRNHSCCGCGASPSDRMRQLSLIHFPVAVWEVVVVLLFRLIYSRLRMTFCGWGVGGEGRREGAFIFIFIF